MTATFNCAHGNRGYGHPGYSLLAGLARPPTDGGASAADLRARGRGGRLRPAVLGQATGRETTLGVDHTRPGGAFGANASLCEADHQRSGQTRRRQAGTSRASSPRAAARAASRAASCIRTRCPATDTALSATARSSTSTGRQVANSAVTVPRSPRTRARTVRSRAVPR